MKQNTFESFRLLLLGGLAVLLFWTTLIACSAGFFTHIGLVVNEDNLIRLENSGPHDGIWRTDDLTVKYRYTRTGDNLMISGDIQFDSRLKHHLVRFNDFDLWIHIINSENKIVGNKNLSLYGFHFKTGKIPFTETIELPPDIKAICFSYSGKAGIGGTDGTYWDFWKTPNG